MEAIRDTRASLSLNIAGFRCYISAARKGRIMDLHQEEKMTSQPSPTTWVVRPDPDLADLIPSFMQNRKNELAELQQARSRKDYEFIRRMSHTWKGICRPYGFVHLETLSRSLEEAGGREDAAEVERIMNEMASYLENVRIVYDN
jgi:HPt (histidine-containing phosphotransfer) domain-containing protein